MEVQADAKPPFQSGQGGGNFKQFRDYKSRTAKKIPNQNLVYGQSSRKPQGRSIYCVQSPDFNGGKAEIRE